MFGRTLILCLLVAGTVFAANPYEILGVARNAGPGVIDAAFQAKLEAHGGRVPPEVREAYLTLNDATKRKKVDEDLDRRSRVARHREWRETLRAQLVADYALRHRDPAQRRAGMLRMLTEERGAAWDRMFPPGLDIGENDREGHFWNHYRASLWEPLPEVLHLAMDELDSFLAARPSFDEVMQYLDLVDMRGYLWKAATRSRNHTRVPCDEEHRANEISIVAYSALVEREDLPLPDFVKAMGEYWRAVRYLEEMSRPEQNPMARWLTQGSQRFATTPEKLWFALVDYLRSERPERKSIEGLELLVPAVAGTVPARILLEHLSESLRESTRGNSSSELLQAGRRYAAAVRAVAAADPAVAARLQSARGFLGRAAAWRSEDARCLRALAEAAETP